MSRGVLPLDTPKNIAESLVVKKNFESVFNAKDIRDCVLKFRVSLHAIEQWIVSRGYCVVKATAETRRNHVSLETLVAIRRDCYGLTDEEAEEYRKQREEYDK